MSTIRREYNWEVAEDTSTTWRIGDGTAAFYNYIYQTIAGFAEDEVMLSNMIREQHLTRTVDVHVAGLRQKLEANPKSPEYILTVHGLGYKFAG